MEIPAGSAGAVAREFFALDAKSLVVLPDSFGDFEALEQKMWEHLRDARLHVKEQLTAAGEEGTLEFAEST